MSMSAVPAGVPSIIQDKEVRRLGRRMLAVYKEHDAEATKREEENNASCRKGCSSCCHHLIFITMPEAVAMAEAMFKKPIFWQAGMEAFLAKLKIQIDVLSGDKEHAPKEGEEGMACPLLTDEGECAVYDSRPSPCRFYAVNSDPAMCKTDKENPVSRINMQDLEDKVRAAATRVSKQVGTHLGLSPLPVALPLALKALTEGRAVLNDYVGEDSKQQGALSLTYWEEVLKGSVSEVAEEAPSETEKPESMIILTDADD